MENLEHAHEEQPDNSFSRLLSQFDKYAIDYTSPGFHLHEPFMRAEQLGEVSPHDYARYVIGKEYTPEYLNQAETIVSEMVKYMEPKIMFNGACVDASMVLSSMLDELGVWNYIATGGMTISFKPSTGTPGIVHFAPLMAPGNPAITGHAWIVSPPFNIVDITASKQSYQNSQLKQYVPKITLSKTFTTSEWEIDDIVENKLQPILWAQGISQTREGIELIDPGLLSRLVEYGVRSIDDQHVSMKYLCTSPGLQDGNLDDMRKKKFSNSSPRDLLQDFLSQSNIRPIS